MFTNKQYRIIKTDKGYVAVINKVINNYDIKEVFWYVEETTNNGKFGIFKSEIGNSIENSFEIIATDTSFKLEGVPQFKLEDSIEDLAEKVLLNYLTNDNPNGDFKKSTIGADDYKNWWIAGYKAAQSKGTYTEEQMRAAFDEGSSAGTSYVNEYIGFDNNAYDRHKECYIKSLNQPKELIAVEFEMTFKYCQREAEDESKCNIQCEHCAEYYKPLEELKINENGLLTVIKYIYKY